MNYEFNRNRNSGLEGIVGGSLTTLPKQTYFKSRHSTMSRVKEKGQAATRDGYFGDRNLLGAVKVQGETPDTGKPINSDSASLYDLSQTATAALPNELRLHNKHSSTGKQHNRSLERFNQPAFQDPAFKAKASATSSSQNPIPKQS